MDNLLSNVSVSVSNISGLQTALDSKASTTQLNSKQDVIIDNGRSMSPSNGLSTSLANKNDKSEMNTLLVGKQDTIQDNGLSISKKTNFQSSLDSKATTTQLNTKAKYYSR